MKRTAGLICGVMIVALTISAHAQYPGAMGVAPGGSPPGGVMMGGAAGGPMYASEEVYADGSVVMGNEFAAEGNSGLGRAPFVSAMPNSMFIGANLSNEGLGYRSSYASMGAKIRLTEDFMKGRWTFEPRGGINLDDGQAFGSVGFERFQTINSAFSDVSVAGWVDGDGDTQGSFGTQYLQLGLTGKITRGKFIIQTNGYLPIGNTGELASPGRYDTAMQGADAFIGLPLPMHQMVNARIDLGGYYYNDPNGFAPDFGGFKGRLNLVGYGGVNYNIEMNTDQLNGFTGVLQIVGVFGGHDSYSTHGNDLIRTLRNDHVVRIHQP